MSSHTTWKAVFWISLWVAIGGLYACIFAVRAEVKAMRYRVDHELVTHEHMRAWTHELARDNNAALEVPEF